MSLTPDQKRVAEAYAHCFATAPATQIVLDDLTVTARNMGDPLERAGATSLLLHILLRRSQIRRDQAREKKGHEGGR